MESLWTNDELAILDTTDELELTVGGKPVTIWVITVEGQVFVRSVYGRGSKWFQRALAHSQGSVSVASLSKEVRLADSGERCQSAIDEAFRAKYRRYARSIVDSTVSTKARGATLQVFVER